MLINFSNHPTSTWSKRQMETAIAQFDEVVDFPFPQIDPESSTEQIKILAQQLFDELIDSYDKENITIHLMGELSIVYQLVNLFKKADIPCVVSTTKREVEELPDGSINSLFRFVKFRAYY
ncbi:MAG: hypothetical protein PHQ01_04660 [Candidatus Pacebacteria bacterium]|nr:hypothetical protein [Candidatus Paceibacterota bacterium]